MTALPPVSDPRPGRRPQPAERTLPSGLRVIAVRRPGVPLVELRLRIPLPGRTAAVKARKQLMAQTIKAGTPGRDAVAIASRLDELGATLGASTGADALMLSGSVIADRLRDLLDLMGEILAGADYPEERVRNERARLGHQLLIRRSQPAVLAGEALRGRLFSRHPYGLPMPLPTTVQRIGRTALRSQHSAGVVPAGATLVLAGELRPAPVLDMAAGVLDGWRGGPGADPVPAPPPVVAGPVRIVNRSGAVQTNIRIAGPALTRSDPAHAAQVLANLVFGGYFASRLSANVREDKGYSYSPHSSIEHAVAGSRFVVTADVATEVTAAALNEIRYELARMATTPVPADELAKARRFRAGSLIIGTQTQSGLAGHISSLAVHGLGVDFLRDHVAALAAVEPTDVQAVALEGFRPDRLVAVMVGDAARIAPSMTALGDVEVVES